jgi:acyl-CoA reductase-like NAD-dependent aldehyde dehydrogenase
MECCESGDDLKQGKGLISTQVHSLTLRAILTPIMAGNTVVLKTSEITPYTQSLWAELLQASGLPSGVLEVVHISTDTAPQRIAQLVSDQRVR